MPSPRTPRTPRSGAAIAAVTLAAAAVACVVLAPAATAASASASASASAQAAATTAPAAARPITAWRLDAAPGRITPDAAALADVGRGDRISIPLLDGAVTVATVVAVDHPRVDAARIVARTDRGADVVIAVRGSSVAAAVMGEGDRDVRVMGTADGGHRLETIPAGLLAGCQVDTVPAADPADLDPLAGLGGCGNGEVIDVLMVFTPEAVDQLGSIAAVEANIDLQVMTGNQALQNSGIATTYRTVHARLLPPGFDEIPLSQLRTPDDGVIDEVHPLRDAYRADIIAMVRSGGGGVAAGLSSLDPGFESSAMCINGVDSAPYVIGHEIGHLMGACHAVGDGGGCNVGLLFDFSNGHRFFAGGDQYRTIMAYSPGSRIAHYSNPDVDFGGTATGVADEADNAFTLNASRELVSGFRCFDTVCFDLDLPADAPDCNGNLIPDACEIARGLLPDVNGNGVPDGCECIGDLDGDGAVDLDDLIAVLAAWGPCPGGCDTDLNGDEDTGLGDVIVLLAAWNGCG